MVDHQEIIHRPLDLLDSLKGRMVTILLIDDEVVDGVLLAFDLYINLVVKNKHGKLLFIKGTHVVSVVSSEE